MKHWPIVSFAEAVDILDSRRVPVNSTERSKRQGSIPYYGATGQTGVIDDFLFDEELVLLGEDGAPFLESGKPKAYLIRGKSWVNNHAHVLRGKPGLLNSFLLYQLNNLDYRPYVSGTTRLKLPQGPMKQIPLLVPPEDDQRRIVAEIEKQFTRLEAGVAALRRVQANLKRYRAAVLKAACEGRLVHPDGTWELTTLGEVSTVLAGYGFPERLQGRSTGEIGFFKVGDISEAWKRREKILTRANHYISKTDLAELRAKTLPSGTVVFAKIGAAIALNRRAIIGEPSLVDNNVMGLLAGARIQPRYLFHFLCTQKLDELARATTVPSIRKGDVEGIELKLPHLAEQTRIVAEVERRLSVVEELEATVTTNLQRATRLRQAVLQKAFTGELTP